MARVKVSDGRSVKVIADKNYKDGDFAFVSGFHGFVIGDTPSGDPLVINIEQSEFEFKLADVVTGDVIYFAGGALTKDSAAEGAVPVLRASTDSDAGGIAWGILLPQSV